MYHANEVGIGLADGPVCSWADLDEALASVMSPLSSAAAIRADLIDALNQGEVDGRVDLLVVVLERTKPCFVSQPDFSNEEIAAIAMDRD